MSNLSFYLQMRIALFFVVFIVLISFVLCQTDNVDEEKAPKVGRPRREFNAEDIQKRREAMREKSERVKERNREQIADNDDDDDATFVDIAERGAEEILRHMESRHPRRWDKETVPRLFEIIDADESLNKIRVENMHQKWTRYLEKEERRSKRQSMRDEL